MQRIAVVGAGSIGGSIGGLLSKAGQDVTLLDPWTEHVRAMQQQGLVIDDTSEQHRVPVRVMHWDDLPSLTGTFDVVILSTRAYDTEQAAHRMLPYLGENSVVVSAQNGLCEEILAPVIGAERTIGCVVMLSARVRAPGHLYHLDPMKEMGRPPVPDFKLGELDGRETPRLMQMLALFSLAGRATTTDNLWGERWAKLTLNSMNNAVAGVSGLRAVQEQPECRALTHVLAAEAVRVGRTLGYRIATIEDGLSLDAIEERGAQAIPVLQRAAQQGIAAVAAPAAQQQSGLMRDLLSGRRTEVDYLNGYIARRGAAIGVPALYNAAATAVVKEIEAGTRQIGLHNVAHIAAMASQEGAA